MFFFCISFWNDPMRLIQRNLSVRSERTYRPSRNMSNRQNRSKRKHQKCCVKMTLSFWLDKLDFVTNDQRDSGGSNGMCPSLSVARIASLMLATRGPCSRRPRNQTKLAAGCLQASRDTCRCLIQAVPLTVTDESWTLNWEKRRKKKKKKINGRSLIWGLYFNLISYLPEKGRSSWTKHVLRRLVPLRVTPTVIPWAVAAPYISSWRDTSNVLSSGP